MPGLLRNLRAATPTVTVTDSLGLGTSSIVGFAASGGLASSGWPHQPPCNAPSWLALDGAGVYAAVMAAVAVLCRRRGHVVHYEIPYAETAVSAATPWSRPLHSYNMQAAGQGTLTARLGPDGFPIASQWHRTRTSTWTALCAADASSNSAGKAVGN